MRPVPAGGRPTYVADLLDDVGPARGRGDHHPGLLERRHALLPRVGLP